MPTLDIILALSYLFSDHSSFPEGALKRFWKRSKEVLYQEYGRAFLKGYKD